MALFFINSDLYYSIRVSFYYSKDRCAAAMWSANVFNLMSVVWINWCLCVISSPLTAGLYTQIYSCCLLNVCSETDTHLSVCLWSVYLSVCRFFRFLLLFVFFFISFSHESSHTKHPPSSLCSGARTQTRYLSLGTRTHTREHAGRSAWGSAPWQNQSNVLLYTDSRNNIWLKKTKVSYVTCLLFNC